MDVRLPDGTIIKNVPEGTTQEELLARYEGYQRMSPSARRGESFDVRMSNAPPARNATSSLAHGAIDTAGAVAQLVSRGASALGLPEGTDLPFIASPEIVERGISRAREQTNRTLGEPQPGGLDLLRGGASAALSAPYMGSVGTAASMPGRAAQAARAGAIGGALQPVSPGKQDEFFREKMFQAGTGAATGALAQPALEMGAAGVQKIADSVIRRGSGVLTKASDEVAYKIASQAAAQQGMRFDQLSKATQQSILKDVQETLKKYGGVNTAAVGRQADFMELGVDPLKPWVTRDPVEWGQYKNLEGAKDAGEPLIQARAGLDRKLMERLSSLRGKGNTGDAFESGRIIQEGFSAKHNAARQNVTALYDKFRETAPNVAADPKRMVDTILDAVEKDALGDFLGPLRNLVNDFATGKRPTTPDSLYRAQQVANAVVRKGGAEGMAARKIVEGIDNELEQMGRDMSAVGPEMAKAAELLKKARGAHRSLKMAEEAIPALKAVAEGTFAPEDFLGKYLVGGDVREVAAMWANSDAKMKQAARSQITDYLKKTASGGGAEDAAVFRQARFGEILDSPGMKQKLEIILGQKGVEEVKRVYRAAESAIRTPAGARYNTSGTAIEMMNLLKRSTGLPVLGPMVTDPMQKLLTQAQVSGMSKAGPSAMGAGLLDPFYEEMLKRARQRGAGLLSGAGGTTAAGELTR